MVIMSMKVNKNLVRMIALILVALVVGIVVWTIARPNAEETATSGMISADKLKSNEDRVAFIKSYGWEINESAVEVMEVTIPEEFDEVYKVYADLQAEQGLDLEKYAGKNAKRWSYTLLNYPDATEEVRVNLLIYNDKLIACDISSTELGGFMQGIMPAGERSAEGDITEGEVSSPEIPPESMPPVDEIPEEINPEATSEGTEIIAE